MIGRSDHVSLRLQPAGGHPTLKSVGWIILILSVAEETRSRGRNENTMRIKDRPEYRSKPVPFSVSADDLIQTAVEIMSEKNVGSVVIVDDDMQVKGIVTERDLMRLDGQTTRFASIMTSEVRRGNQRLKLLPHDRCVKPALERPRGKAAIRPGDHVFPPDQAGQSYDALGH